MSRNQGHTTVLDVGDGLQGFAVSDLRVVQTRDRGEGHGALHGGFQTMRALLAFGEQVVRDPERLGQYGSLRPLGCR